MDKFKTLEQEIEQFLVVLTNTTDTLFTKLQEEFRSATVKNKGLIDEIATKYAIISNLNANFIALSIDDSLGQMICDDIRDFNTFISDKIESDYTSWFDEFYYWYTNQADPQQIMVGDYNEENAKDVIHDYIWYIELQS